MPKFDLAIPNPLSKEQALERVQGFSKKLEEQYGDQLSDLEQSWNGDELAFSFKTFGFKIDGTLTIEEEKVIVAGNLPLAAVMAKGKITSAIEDQLQRLLR